MDSYKPQSVKQLKEHLQHHQEPFSLQNYLIERSYMFKNCNSDSIHSLYSAKNLKWSIKYDLHKIKKRFLHATGMLRSLLYKFIPTDENQEFSSWDEEHYSDQYYVHELTAASQETQETSEHFSLKRLAVSDHFTNNDVEDKVLPYQNHSSTKLQNMFQTFTLPRLKRSEIDTGTKPYWISSKENQQHYRRGSEWKEPLPNTVCHLRSPEAPVTTVSTLSQKLVRDSMFSTYLRKLLVNSNMMKFRRARKDKLEGMDETASLCRRNRRILQKRKQLQFDCEEKLREFHKNEGKIPTIKAVSESQDLQSIIHDHFSFLEKQYREIKKITHLLHTESSVISEEWKSFQIVNWEIHVEIGDSIMDDIVREIVDSFLTAHVH